MKKYLFLVLIFSTALSLAQNETLFESATKAYNEGEFEVAIEHYEKILNNEQHSANIYFNLGNSYYKLNKIGPSIYYYEKALLLSPNDPEILNNLAFAQKMAIDIIEPMPQTAISKIVSGLKNIFTYDQWAYASVIFMGLFVILYLSFYFSVFSDRKRIAFIGSLISLLLMLVSILFAAIQIREYKTTQPAIIFANETSAREEPNKASNLLFELHEGSKVYVEAELNDWNKIRLADGKNGWIPSDDLKKLKDF